MEADPDGTNMITQILFLLLLTSINAFFSCAEMATVSVNKNKINMMADDGNKKAQQIQRLLEEPTRFLSTIQVAITLAGFFASASAATGISQVLGDAISKMGIPYGEQISFVLVTIVLSYFTLVFGELVPKRIALQKAEAISMFSVKPVMLVSKIAAPFVKFLTFSTNLTLRMIKMEADNLEELVSREEIKSMVEVGQVTGVFNRTEKEMINSIFEFDDKLAKEVMTPRINVYAIDITEPLSSYLDEMLETKYSRIPVYDEDIDNIVGVLYMKDFFLEARKHGFDNVDIKSILHKPYLVPEGKNIDELFKELQQTQRYIAILIDEYGGFSGIVTIEDLVEEVMGDIEDEYDDGEPKIKKIDHDSYIIDGLITIDELNNKLDLDISSDNYDTLSGLLIDIMGTIPQEGDDRTIELENLVFKLESIKEKRIEKIALYIKREKKEKDETSEKKEKH
ncbi:hemolysin family protein [Anaerobium acetethylicum]|uniref:Putative hemolysin n=1 Tax=Anaerobium acetethylicum TaxID=1619234 RepID=A0A1D3TNY2_9FIRM|nr:hemolysin family protein [Anaerobium acetethylicum]SCP95065.1 putative hemolysin [Anaerobium acetethylicum]